MYNARSAPCRVAGRVTAPERQTPVEIYHVDPMTAREHQIRKEKFFFFVSAAVVTLVSLVFKPLAVPPHGQLAQESARQNRAEVSHVHRHDGQHASAASAQTVPAQGSRRERTYRRYDTPAMQRYSSARGRSTLKRQGAVSGAVRRTTLTDSSTPWAVTRLAVLAVGSASMRPASGVLPATRT